jgi:hypothetical protein
MGNYGRGGSWTPTTRASVHAGHWFVVGVLLLALLTISPLAHASPSEESWIHGLYDNSDLDDVIFLVTNGTSIVDSNSLWSLRLFSAVVRVFSEDRPAPPRLVPIEFSPSRAPPTA